MPAARAAHAKFGNELTCRKTLSDQQFNYRVAAKTAEDCNYGTHGGTFRDCRAYTVDERMKTYWELVKQRDVVKFEAERTEIACKDLAMYQAEISPGRTMQNQAAATPTPMPAPPTTSSTPGPQQQVRPIRISQLTSKGSSGKASITTLDGRPCIQVRGPKRRDVYKHMYDAYDFEIQNICDRHFSLRVYTNAGGYEPVDINANMTRKWSCTDGLSSNKDCRGGISNVEVH